MRGIKRFENNATISACTITFFDCHQTSAKSVLAKLLHILDSFSRLSEREGSIFEKYLLSSDKNITVYLF